MGVKLYVWLTPFVVFFSRKSYGLVFTCFGGTNLGVIFMATEEYISWEFSLAFTRLQSTGYMQLGNIFEVLYVEIMHLIQPMKCYKKDYTLYNASWEVCF